MDDLIDDPQPGENAHEFTVSEISGAVKRVVEGEFGRVRVKGEVGRVVWARSGHLYFDLKDDRAVLAAVSWKGQAARLPVKPEEGMEVVALGRLTTFPGQSKYQMIVDDVRPAGIGALMAMLEKRKKTLESEGLFAAERKRPLPYLPDVVGVVTSPTGAVIRDILHRLRDRFPRKVLVWPVAVQGERSAPEVVAAIEGFNAMSPGGALPRPDVLIVARGGGSIEDLWSFNEEAVVRAAAASDIPLISAVGHETDTTLIDFASDRRAPTPTAAAEMAVPVRLDLLAWIDGQAARLSRGLSQSITQRRQRLADLSRALPVAGTLLSVPSQRLDAAVARLGPALRGAAAAKRAALAETALRPATIRALMARRRDRFGTLGARLAPAFDRMLKDRARETARARTELDRLNTRLAAAWPRSQTRRTEQLDDRARLLGTLGYEATLARGFALVWDGDKVVKSVVAARQADALELQFADGRVGTEGASAAPRPPRKQRSSPDSSDQGSLF
ncbi:MAG: exodeoxyribonuclease VII large subunit [Pseudomonadota bacterium]